MSNPNTVSKVALIALMVSAANLGACKETPREVVIQAVHSQVSAKMDPSLSTAERNRLVGVVADMMRADVRPAANSAFAKVFGTTGMTGVAEFLNQRIQFVISQGNILEDQLFIGRILPPGQQATDRDIITVLDVGDAFKVPTGGDMTINASNVGALLMFQAAVTRSQNAQLYFSFGNRLYPVTSSRIGVVQVGNGFTRDGGYATLAGEVKPTTWVTRSATLVHEARHSDCTGGISAADIGRLVRGQEPENNSCSYGHITCPATVTMPGGRTSEHPYAGITLCDASPWGSNGISLAYSSEITKCGSCSEHEKEEALMEMVDRLMRAPFPMNALDPAAGAPDLSSRGLTGND